MSLKFQHEFKPARVLVFGLGDLGVRIAQLIVENRAASTCLLAGRSNAAQQWAQLLQISSGQSIQSARVDGQDVEALKKLFTEFQPDLIVQCASLLSPFAFSRRDTPAARAILKGGFALQAAAQLPIIRAVMQARKSLGLTCPVINCSYPDVTHPILAAEGLTPSAGIGNVAIMAMRFARMIPGADAGTLRVIGHHAQLPSSLAGNEAPGPAPIPLAYLQGQKLESQQLLLRPGLAGGPMINHLAAATILPLLRGFLGCDAEIEAHASGVFGLPGGYPIRFREGEMELSLPEGVSQEEAIQFNQLAAAGDGVGHIGDEGTLFYTEEAREAVAPWCPELAEPLAIKDLNPRLSLLRSLL